MAANCPAISRSSWETLFNATEILHQRWEDSPEDNRKRLELCWGYNDCGDCHRSKGHCGWCAISNTCLPLPMDPLSRAFPLLSPIRYKFICATGPERFELRTSGLGCQVSTITFLTSVVTIFCTLFGVLVIYLLFRTAERISFTLKARKGGWVVYADGREDIWVRKSEGLGRWWRQVIGRPKEHEVLEVDGGTRGRSWRAWMRRSRDREGRNAISENRPLLG
ncbi:uncharacterized protein CC84DRAFT_808176 [Paraphaeosphaeria sporulosa]|uniref:PSI domain-containing protein n=1 Tax=Paraphaeosphaeria sporulosa TaxID=1460663 RepID=A0A177CDJ2_9PLEO|nr:uncharacterized protein CC84DRAFT_808176 [Paraphaeosphaeria sporulosa]OAG04869.1 hypothetical protein CC84DRAFT_808176 [Paraphaeosphaeria sporulosa]